MKGNKPAGSKSGIATRREGHRKAGHREGE